MLNRSAYCALNKLTKYFDLHHICLPSLIAPLRRSLVQFLETIDFLLQKTNLGHWEPHWIARTKALNDNPEIDGFIVQLPLPKHIDEQKILMAVHPDKDVDGFHPMNVGRLTLDLPTFISATPYGIMELLERYEIPTSGKHVVVIGRSHIVGRPMSILMSQKRPAGNATVTVAHSRTSNLAALTKEADIIVAALGIPEFLTADMVKKDAVVIDVGITRVPDDSKKRGYRIVGDVHFDSVAEKASYITPVPGGVGPMTIAMLLKNTLHARQRAEAH